MFSFQNIKRHIFDKISEEASYDELLGIGITEVSMKLISCHGFTKKKNPTVILVSRSRLLNYYLAKGFVILEHNSKQLISVPNDAKLIIHAINKQKRILCYGVLHSNLLYSKHHK